MSIVDKAVDAVKFIGYSTFDYYQETDKFPVLGIYMEQYPNIDNLYNKLGLPNCKGKTCEELKSLDLVPLIRETLQNNEDVQISIMKGYLEENMKLVSDITDNRSILIALVWSLYHPKRVKALLSESFERGLNINDPYIVYQYLEHEVLERSNILDCCRYHAGITNLYSYATLLVDWG